MITDELEKTKDSIALANKYVHAPEAERVRLFNELHSDLKSMHDTYLQKESVIFTIDMGLCMALLQINKNSRSGAAYDFIERKLWGLGISIPHDLDKQDIWYTKLSIAEIDAMNEILNAAVDAAVLESHPGSDVPSNQNLITQCEKWIVMNNFDQRNLCARINNLCDKSDNFIQALKLTGYELNFRKQIKHCKVKWGK